MCGKVYLGIVCDIKIKCLSVNIKQILLYTEEQVLGLEIKSKFQLFI